MIPFGYITEWRAQAPWTTDAQVEQDLVLSRAVVTMFAVPEVAGLLAFRGGTALYKLHLRPPARREILPRLPGDTWKGGERGSTP